MYQLAQIALDMWLLAQRSAGESLPVGNVFQAAVADALRRPGVGRVQRAGLHTLWELRAASGVAHELDAAARATGRAYFVEAKATHEVGKADLAMFELKVTDFYFSRWRAVGDHAWFPLLCSAGPVSAACRRLALHRAITLCDPDRLPVPVLYHHAKHPAARYELPRDLCAEMLRLAPRSLASLQRRYVANHQHGGLLLRPSTYTPEELKDLLYLQDELTDNVLDRYDRLAPGRLEARGAMLRRSLRTRWAA
jgi:hypothetical protein